MFLFLFIKFIHCILKIRFQLLDSLHEVGFIFEVVGELVMFFIYNGTQLRVFLFAQLDFLLHFIDYLVCDQDIWIPVTITTFGAPRQELICIEYW